MKIAALVIRDGRQFHASLASITSPHHPTDTIPCLCSSLISTSLPICRETARIIYLQEHLCILQLCVCFYFIFHDWWQSPRMANFVGLSISGPLLWNLDLNIFAPIVSLLMTLLISESCEIIYHNQYKLILAVWWNCSIKHGFVKLNKQGFTVCLH